MAKRSVGKRVQDASGTFTVRGRNGNGSGSVYFDASVGSYRATYRDPSTGRTRTVSGRTKAIAMERRDAKVEELERAAGGRLGDDPTVEDLAKWWVANVAKPSVRPSTLHAYKKDVGRIRAGLGRVPVKDLDTEQIREFLAGLSDDGLSASTRRNARTQLRQIVEHAVELGYLPSNPVSRVPVPRAAAEERRQRRVLKPDEVRRLLNQLDGTRMLDAAIALLFTSGMRVSEVLGLAWSDIDLEEGTAVVRRGCTYTGGGIGARLDRPKTESTVGIHHLAPTVITLLKERRRRQDTERERAGEAWEPIVYEGQKLDLVFTSRTGGLVLRQNVSTLLQRLCKAAKIDPDGVATHTGRRSVVTSLYVDGLPLDDVARHVGHSSPTTTAGYVQELGTRPVDTARRAAALLDPAGKG